MRLCRYFECCGLSSARPLPSLLTPSSPPAGLPVPWQRICLYSGAVLRIPPRSPAVSAEKSVLRDAKYPKNFPVTGNFVAETGSQSSASTARYRRQRADFLAGIGPFLLPPSARPWRGARRGVRAIRRARRPREPASHDRRTAGRAARASHAHSNRRTTRRPGWLSSSRRFVS